jgi:hypothetical protein
MNSTGVSSTANIVTWTEDYNWKVQLPGINPRRPVWGSKLFLINAFRRQHTRIVVMHQRRRRQHAVDEGVRLLGHPNSAQ